jgi:hypothetical protein
MTPSDSYAEIDPAALLEQVEASLCPINEGAEPGDISTVRYPWEGMARDGKIYIVEQALAAMEVGGALSDEASSSLERCIDSVRTEDKLDDQMNEYAPHEIRRIGMEKSIAFNGLVSRLRKTKTATRPE